MATLESNARNAAANAVAGLMNSGTAVFETSADAEVGTCTFGATAFGSASSGVATANAITKDSDAAGGTIEHVTLYTSAAAKVMECTCGTSGAEFTIGSLAINAGDEIDITELKLTMPAS